MCKLQKLEETASQTVSIHLQRPWRCHCSESRRPQGCLDVPHGLHVCPWSLNIKSFIVTRPIIVPSSPLASPPSPSPFPAPWSPGEGQGRQQRRLARGFFSRVGKGDGIERTLKCHTATVPIKRKLSGGPARCTLDAPHRVHIGIPCETSSICCPSAHHCVPRAVSQRAPPARALRRACRRRLRCVISLCRLRRRRRCKLQKLDQGTCRRRRRACRRRLHRHLEEPKLAQLWEQSVRGWPGSDASVPPHLARSDTSVHTYSKALVPQCVRGNVLMYCACDVSCTTLTQMRWLIIVTGKVMPRLAL